MSKNIKKMVFKKGDKVYFKYRLYTVDKIKNGKVVYISSPAGCWSNTNLICFPANDRIKELSEIFVSFKKELQDYSNSYEWSNVGDYLVSSWIKACEFDSDKHIRKLIIREVKNFVIAAKNAADVQVFDVKLFKS